MHLTIEVVRKPDAFNQTTYTFALFGSTLVLSSYLEQYKMAPFGGWRNRKNYDRTLRDDNTIDCPQIELPEDVQAEALERLFNQVTVAKWDDYKRTAKGE